MTSIKHWHEFWFHSDVVSLIKTTSAGLPMVRRSMYSAKWADLQSESIEIDSRSGDGWMIHREFHRNRSSDNPKKKKKKTMESSGATVAVVDFNQNRWRLADFNVTPPKQSDFTRLRWRLKGVWVLFRRQTKQVKIAANFVSRSIRLFTVFNLWSWDFDRATNSFDFQRKYFQFRRTVADITKKPEHDDFYLVRWLNGKSDSRGIADEIYDFVFVLFFLWHSS